jgi:lipoate-protein ligase A
MIVVTNPYTNPYFNIAAEEYLIQHFPEGFIMIWQNSPSIIVGKHQLALAELNLSFARNNGYPIVRRISGGGTVVHDEGNINFTIALPTPHQTPLIHYRQFIDPVMAYIATFGATPSPSGRNDILLHELKISGNAEHHHRKNKLLLHHGTLLYHSNLSRLSQALQHQSSKYTHKAVASNPSPVTNICDQIPHMPPISHFMDGLQQHLSHHFNATNHLHLNLLEEPIQQLVENRFITDQWNFGYSPAYQFQSSFTFQQHLGTIRLSVAREGIITHAAIEHPDKTLSRTLEHQLHHSLHFPDHIHRLLCAVIPTDEHHPNHPLLFDFF